MPPVPFTTEVDFLALVTLNQVHMLAIQGARENVDYLVSGFSCLFSFAS